MGLQKERWRRRREGWPRREIRMDMHRALRGKRWRNRLGKDRKVWSLCLLSLDHTQGMDSPTGHLL